MLTDDALKQAIRDFYARLATGIPGFKKRAGQRQMIGAIANVLANTRQTPDVIQEGQSIAVIEGKTGVGKTVGYLVPALIMAKEMGKKLVISTGTVALQEQLFNRDIPVVSTFVGRPVSVALAKGRGRYVCTERLNQVAGAAGQDGLFDDDPGDGSWDRKPEEQEIRFLRKMVKRLDSGDWSGDRDEFGESIDADLWARVTTDSNGCSKRRCPSHKDCSYYKARAQLLGADVVVANHDLVISCRASNSNLLPSPQDSIYVFDEAHHLPDVALSRFAKSVQLSASVRWLDRVGPSISRLVAMAPNDVAVMGIADDLDTMRDRLTELAAALRYDARFDAKTAFRYANGVLEDGMQRIATEILRAAEAASRKLDRLANLVDEEIKEGRASAATIEPQLREFGGHVGRLSEFMELWTLLLEDPPEGTPPHAKWISKTPDGRDFVVHASPISAARVLHRYLWSQAAAVVLTSATITTLGEFRFFLKKSGLARLPKVTTLAVVSPFDYQSQGNLLVPRMQSDPAQVEGHTAEIGRLLPELLATWQRGSLVLFASRRQMQAVHALLPEAVQADVLMQGEMPRADLIAEHRRRAGGGARSILFGLAGLGEGLDLPGALCEHVIIAKIPFPPPDSPMEEALAEWVQRKKGNPFSELTLPKAGLIMVQWVGRLIRTENDRGQITILDRRVTTKSYGSRLLNGLPAFARVADH